MPRKVSRPDPQQSLYSLNKETLEIFIDKKVFQKFCRKFRQAENKAAVSPQNFATLLCKSLCSHCGEITKIFYKRSVPFAGR